MGFKIIFSEESLSQLRKLDNQTAKRILDKLESTLKDPKHFFERLAGRDDYKIRIGDYRVLARIMFNEATIFVLSLGHRKNVYERI